MSFHPSAGGGASLSGGGGGGFWRGLSGDLGTMAGGFIPGLESTGAAILHDALHGNGGLLFSGGHPLRGSHIYTKIVQPTIQSERTFWTHPLRNVEQGHIITPILDALTVASLGGGRVAAAALTPKELGANAKIAAALTGKYGGDIRQITARLPSGETQVLKDLPRSGYRAAKAMGVEKVRRAVTGEAGISIGGTPRGGTFARAGKAAKKQAQTHMLETVTDPRVVEWQQAFKKLSVPERIAFHVKARLPFDKDLQTWRGLLHTSDQPAAKQTLDLIDKPQVKALYKAPSSKMTRAFDAWEGISNARQKILLEHGAIDPLQIDEGYLRHTMMMRGAEVLTKSKAYNMLRATDAEIKSLGNRAGTLVKQGMKVGTKEIRQQIMEGRKASTEAMKTSAQKERFHQIGQATDAKLATARGLREEWRTAFQNGISTPKEAKHVGALQAKMAKAYDDYEHALVAEHAYAKYSEKGRLIAERQRAGIEGVKAARESRMTSLQGMRAQLHELLDARHEQEAQKAQIEMLRARIPRSGIGPLVGGPPIEDLLAEYDKAGAHRGYIPDVPAKRKADYITTGEGSIGPPRPQADVYPTTGVMHRHGIIDLVGDHVTAAFFRAARHARQAELHAWAMRAGIKVAKGMPLPDGYEWVKKYRGQRVPFSQTAQAEHIRSTNPFDGLDPDEFDQITGGHELTDAEIESIDNGQYRVAVPKTIANQFRADFTRGGNIATRMVRRATNVWRALLLRVRVGWLENNIVGNTIMASLRFAGLTGLQAYLHLIGQMAGPKKVAELLGMDVTRQALTPEEWARIAPQVERGTHFDTQLPKFVQRFGGENYIAKTAGHAPTIGSRLVKGAGLVEKTAKGALNLLPRADRWYETFLRKGAILTTLRKQPEVRAAYRTSGRNWGNAIVEAVDKNPHLQRLAVQEMNDALGDFMSMSRVEREQIRQLVPFYAWFREIVRVTGKLAVDTPERAKVVQLISQIGAEMTPQDVPSYLQGGIPVHVPSWLGGTDQYGQQSIISTRPMNPLSTPVDLLRAGATLFHGGVSAQSTRALAQQLNPALASVFTLNRPQEVFGIPQTRWLGLQPLSQPIANLPEYRSGSAKDSTLYPTRGLLDRWFQSMGGNPIRTYDITEAANRKGQGQ